MLRSPAACRHRRSVRLPIRCTPRSRGHSATTSANAAAQAMSDSRGGGASAATCAGPSKRCATQPSAASECSPRNTTRMRWSHASRSRQNRAPCAVSPAIAAGPLLPAVVEIVVPEPRHVARHRVDGEAASRGTARERDAGGETRVVKNLVERYRGQRTRPRGERGPRCDGQRRSRQADLQELSATRHHRPDRATHRPRIIRRAAARNRPPKPRVARHARCYTGRA